MHKNIYFGMEKKRYETRGVQERIPLDYRYFMWKLVDRLCMNIQVDYLQVFLSSYEKDSRGRITQKFVHSQEKPEYSAVYEFPFSKIKIEEKVYIIDDGENCTMLLAEEY